jgi:hypothetical protein
LAVDFLAVLFFAAGFAAAFFFAGTIVTSDRCVVSRYARKNLFSPAPTHLGLNLFCFLWRQIAIKIIRNFPIHFKILRTKVLSACPATLSSHP